MALDRKANALTSLAADVLVLPEASSNPRVAAEAEYLWRGRSAHKGLGVLALNGWRLEALDDPQHPWELAARLHDPHGLEYASLLALWTVQAPGWGSYTRQLARTIDRWGERVSTGRWIVAGDLNASAPDRRHLANVAALHALGIRSAYHQARCVEHGEEAHPTLRWTAPGGARRTYHCDLVLLSAALTPFLVDVAVGSIADWVESGLSDHCPVTVTLQDDALAGTA